MSAADITQAIDALIVARIRAVTATDQMDVCDIGPILSRLTSAIHAATHDDERDHIDDLIRRKAPEPNAADEDGNPVTMSVRSDPDDNTPAMVWWTCYGCPRCPCRIEAPEDEPPIYCPWSGASAQWTQEG